MNLGEVHTHCGIVAACKRLLQLEVGGCSKARQLSTKVHDIIYQKDVSGDSSVQYVTTHFAEKHGLAVVQCNISSGNIQWGILELENTASCYTSNVNFRFRNVNVGGHVCYIAVIRHRVAHSAQSYVTHSRYLGLPPVIHQLFQDHNVVGLWRGSFSFVCVITCQALQLAALGN